MAHQSTLTCIFGASCISLLLLVNLTHAALIPQEVIINSGRPTFDEPSTSIPGKIILEEHVSTDLFSPVFTTPYHPDTNEILFGQAPYLADVHMRLNSSTIDSFVQMMDASNISVAVVDIAPPGVQGIYSNISFAIEAAATTNNQLSATYKHNGAYPSRFEFFCAVALQDPASAAAEAKRCVRDLGGVGVLVGGYTNNGSATGDVNDVIYLDDSSNEVFWQQLAALDVPLYLHPLEPPPNQQRVYNGFQFLAGSTWGFSTETAAHALRLMVSGLFDRYPNLKIILGHCGEGLPFSLARIDQRMQHFNHTFWPAQQSMTHYWETNFYVTTAGVRDEPTLVNTLAVTGEDRVMFSVDYPFEDLLQIGAWFDRVEMSSDTKIKIGYANARALLKLDS